MYVISVPGIILNEKKDLVPGRTDTRLQQPLKLRF